MLRLPEFFIAQLLLLMVPFKVDDLGLIFILDGASFYIDALKLARPGRA
jgi:hypothetical protein